MTEFSTVFKINGPIQEQGAQSGEANYTFVQSGTLAVELCNGSACTTGPGVTITVSGGNSPPSPSPTPATVKPGQPVIAWMNPTAAAKSSLVFVWDMWYGQRGTKHRLRFNGNPVTEFSTQFTSTGPLTEQGRQSGEIKYTVTSTGNFQVELCNSDLCTLGSSLTITVTGGNNDGGGSNNQNANIDPMPPSPPAPSDAPCTGVKPGQPATVTPACLAKLEAMKFGGVKHIVGNQDHIPLGANGYFVEWGGYGRKFAVADFNAAQYSKMLFSFLRLKPDGSLMIMDEWATLQASTGMDGLYNYQQPEKERGIMLALTLLKARHPHIKTAFSVGGWTLSGQFSQVTANPATRAAFVQNLLAFANQYGFDAIDIDWEYPVVGGNREAYMAGVNYVEVNNGSTADKQNYVLFLQELRQAVNAEAAVNPRTKTNKKEISIAVGLNPNVIDALDYASILPLVDTVNLMAYDFNGGWSTVASHNAPFYNTYDGILNIMLNAAGQKGKRKKSGNTQAAREAILNSPTAQQHLNKLVVGVPYYGRSWTTAAAKPTTTDFVPYFTGGEANLGSFENGVWDTSDILYLRDGQKQKSSLKGRSIQPGLANATWQGEAWDQYACANLAWINAGGVTQLVSYNDEDSLQHIAKFVREKNLGGTMVWESDGDTHGDATFKLSKAVMNGLNGKTTNINNQALKTCVAGGRE